jgi:long-chain acyl-CoA synthetase
MLKRGEIERLRQEQQAMTGRPREPSADERSWLAERGRDALVAAIGQRIGREGVLPDDNLELDLHLDSMERVELITMLEERVGSQLAPETRATIFTVRSLVDAVLNAPRRDVGAALDTTSEAGSHWKTILAAPPDAAIASELSRPAVWRSLVFFVVLRATRLLVRLFCRIEVRGVEHLPRSGPYLITPNHQAYLDGFVVAMALPQRVLRQVFFVGASEYFETRVMQALSRAANIVPVDPDANLVSAMQAAATGLRLGKVLILFPEGERSIDGTLKPFRKGAAILATELGVPIVPVALDGLFELWPRGRGIAWRRLAPWRRHRISATFGAPLHVTGGDYTESTNGLQRAVRLLLRTGPDAR